jgi:hypothetical protein
MKGNTATFILIYLKTAKKDTTCFGNDHFYYSTHDQVVSPSVLLEAAMNPYLS